MSTTSRPTTAGRAALLGLAALVLAACGSSGAGDETTTPAGAEATATEAAEVIPIKVGTLPIVATSALWYGVDKGIFTEHGLDVTVDTGVGSETMVAATLAHEVDFVTLNSVSLMVALDAGVPLQVASGFSQAWEDGDEDISAVLTRPDSGITDAAGLAGHTVAVNTLNSAGTLTISEAVRAAGGDPEKIQFVEIRYPDMIRALEAGDVDAIWEVEPFITIAQGNGAQIASWNFAESAPGLSTQVMVTAANQDAEVVERFTAALSDALKAAEADQDGLRQVLVDKLEMDPALAERVRMDRFSTEINMDALKTLAGLAQDEGLVSKPVDLAAFDKG
ncbi:ABC transporter substrate-binding protein [Georgenia thermotolerans]|uniref:PhnD/SsuA/transferrin family substrate-binding protein n=1 Tax=Georgenia thermotolerans TaxID=527326 RepID=A0A7J5UTX3_9MICO|nr:ABC transporter substrate-binding protein [Georgenia thermotolerans]KAE8765739.1 PhnD/SsuA/transferrin family substrate-binding protein [Georgenia thermotolerans]